MLFPRAVFKDCEPRTQLISGEVASFSLRWPSVSPEWQDVVLSASVMSIWKLVHHEWQYRSRWLFGTVPCKTDAPESWFGIVTCTGRVLRSDGVFHYGVELVAWTGVFSWVGRICGNVLSLPCCWATECAVKVELRGRVRRLYGVCVIMVWGRLYEKIAACMSELIPRPWGLEVRRMLRCRLKEAEVVTVLKRLKHLKRRLKT